MTKLQWNLPGTKKYETGVDRGVLFHPDENGEYTDGEAWQGLTNVTKSPSGGEANKQYADNQVWLNILSAEEMGLTIECLMFPDGFMRYDGLVELAPGVVIGQQPRTSFGFAWRSLIGSDLDGQDHGYKIHLAYGCLAAPSEASNPTVNDSPEPTAFSYTVSTTPREVENRKPTSYLEIDSTKVDPDELAAFEQVLYGTDLVDPAMPSPEAVAALFSGATMVTATEPVHDAEADTVTIPTIAGVEYLVDGEVVPAGVVAIPAEGLVVRARPTEGYFFAVTSDDDWFFEHS